MSKEKPVALIGSEFGNISGSRNFKCSGCGLKIYLSPDGQQTKRLNPSIVLLCLTCADEICKILRREIRRDAQRNARVIILREGT